MRKSKFTESQIMAILKQNEAGIPVPELCRKRIDPADVLQKMKQLLKAIDAHPRVVHKERLRADMNWTVV